MKKILQIINEVSEEVFLQHSIEEIDLERQIITKYGGKITDISYFIPEFKEPLTRKIDEYDDEFNSHKFISHIESDSKQKESLAKLYELSNNIHSHHISAPDKENLDRIIQELKKHGLVIEKPVKN